VIGFLGSSGNIYNSVRPKEEGGKLLVKLKESRSTCKLLRNTIRSTVSDYVRGFSSQNVLGPSFSYQN
jgi:hypothetical protein